MTVEILLAACNGAAFLPAQLDSIVAQTDADWHLTISDDGSTDDTVRIMDEYAEKYPGKIERVSMGRTFGNARDHFTELIRRSDAPWCFLCDQDDTWAPEKIATFRRTMDEAETTYGAETPLLIFCDQAVTDVSGNEVAPSLMRYQKQFTKAFDYRSILMQNVVTGGAMAFNRALRELALECRDFSGVIMHDWWMAVVAAKFGRILYLDEPLGTYRQHGANAVGAKAVGSVSYAKDRMSKLEEVRETIRKKKQQAALFRNTYRSRLTGKDLEFLDGFAKAKSGPGFYWKYGKLIHGAERKAGMALLG